MVPILWPTTNTLSPRRSSPSQLVLFAIDVAEEFKPALALDETEGLLLIVFLLLPRALSFVGWLCLGSKEDAEEELLTDPSRVTSFSVPVFNSSPGGNESVDSEVLSFLKSLIQYLFSMSHEPHQFSGI